MKLPVHAESAQTLARATRAESRCRCCCRAEAPAAAAADAPKLPLLLPLTPAPVVGAAIVVVAVLHALLELCRVPRFNTLGPHPLTVTLGRFSIHHYFSA